jgi:RimJ/RimL family protein N-acetyltransferase
VTEQAVQVLESERLRMRAWTQSDAAFVFDMYSRWDVQRFIGTSPRVMEDLGEAHAAIDRWTSRPHPVFGVWAVEHRQSGRLLGTLLLKPIPASGDQTPLPSSGDIEIGWHFHPDAWGQGFATEAGARGLAHAFDAGLAEVVAVTNVANMASQRVALRIGMIHRGQTDRYYNTTCELFTAANKP